MTIKLINKKDIKDIEISENTTIADILKKEEIPIETVVVKLNGDTVTEDEKVKNGDEIEIIKVIYGG
ncbi:MoaD/ThiS family protein [Methanosphaera sp.]|uniref:MoaD/ThiS family protein n=1 Tax=Methanosphaera sp. TaxID=2666342 RepID=UPI0026DFAD5D|nr:MoaD/ThiS family protein [Methanosphaera sp.]MDO5822592.1 MoaD/ThiS family protein [Methanosphaera sp.]